MNKMGQGFRTAPVGGIAAPPYTNGPYTFSEHITFTGGVAGVNTKGKVYFVDGTSGSDSNDGMSWGLAKSTIQAAVTAAGAFGVVYVIPKAMAAGVTDPGSYAESVIIPATHECLSIIGVGHRTQGGLPQIKPAGAAHVYALTIRSCGCYIANLGFNGNSTAGAPLNGAILLDDDNSTKSTIGTTIENCHFKNCAGTTVTDCRTGGAIDWCAAGNNWQVRIVHNRFYKNVCDICLLGTSNSVPQDVVIEYNLFSGPTASVDTQLYLAGGSGMNGVIIQYNMFPVLGTLGSAVVKRFISATGCVGNLNFNTFGCALAGTFGVAGDQALIPTTMFMAGNLLQGAVANDNYQGGNANRT